ncbi:hypothetical protein GCM10022225_59140 [Plantactinospora mayteni]|uniref:Uncharacterized protein n=1 Tax=Plantactinospora mayteni TaxID=566021 RepID=A0ABQ4EKJ9_9ACTN|nr:hypothetical protein Pma05_18080 [Plantactinospora mayteni]
MKSSAVPSAVHVTEDGREIPYPKRRLIPKQPQDDTVENVPHTVSGGGHPFGDLVHFDVVVIHHRAVETEQQAPDHGRSVRGAGGEHREAREAGACVAGAGQGPAPRRRRGDRRQRG